MRTFSESAYFVSVFKPILGTIGTYSVHKSHLPPLQHRWDVQFTHTHQDRRSLATIPSSMDDSFTTVSELPRLAVAIADSSKSSTQLKGMRTHRTAEEDISIPFEGLGTVESPFIVCWREGERSNPLLWAAWRKWSIVLIVGMATLCTAAGSSLYAGGFPQIVRYFNTTETTAIAGLSVYVSRTFFFSCLCGADPFRPPARLWDSRKMSFSRLDSNPF